MASGRCLAARGLNRGDIWFYRFGSPDKGRPVLVLSRQEAVDVLDTVMVAPVTSRRHGIPTEVELDDSHGLKLPSAVNLDHVHTVAKRDLHRYVGTLPPAMMHAVCRALAIASGCMD